VAHWQLWTILAVLLLIAEMIAPGFWLACVAIGALAAGAVSFFTPGLLLPLLAFSVGTLVSFVTVRPALLRHFGSGRPTVRTNVDALIGKVGMVSERIDPGTGRGRVVVDGEDWRGAAIEDSAIEPGSKVLVVRVEGNVLFVDREP